MGSLDGDVSLIDVILRAYRIDPHDDIRYDAMAMRLPESPNTPGILKCRAASGCLYAQQSIGEPMRVLGEEARTIRNATGK